MVVCKLFGEGDHVPVIPFVEVIGKAGKALPAQMAEIGEKTGVMFGLTIISPFRFVAPFQNPPPDGLYPPYTVQPL